MWTRCTWPGSVRLMTGNGCWSRRWTGGPGAAFTVRCLPREAWHAHGGDVLVRLQPDTGSMDLPAVLAEVWAVVGGHLILAGTWNRELPHG